MRNVHPVIGLILIAVWLGCAPTQPTVAIQPVAVTDRSELVGTWAGNRQSRQGIFPVEIEIQGEDLKGIATYYRTKTGTWTDKFHGKFVGDELRIEWDQTHWIRLHLFKPEGGRTQLKGPYQRGKAEGSMTLEKK